MANVMELVSRLDSGQAQGLAAELAARRGAPLTLDAGAVENVSALAIEVIIAAARQWALDGQAFALAGRSARFAETCAVLGLDPERPWCCIDFPADQGAVCAASASAASLAGDA